MASRENTLTIVNGTRKEKGSEGKPKLEGSPLRQTTIFAEKVEEEFGVQGSFKYVELATYNYTRRGQIATFDETENYIRDYPAWRSYFTFDDCLKSYLADHKGVGTSYDLPVGLQEVVFDLDSESDLTLALADMKMLVRYLIADLGVPAESIRVFFSGGKGFHIHIPNLFGLEPDKSLPMVLKQTIEEEFSFLQTLDTSMIHRGGLIRIPFSIHNKSGLYKQEIPYEKVFDLTIEEAIEMSQSPKVIGSKEWKYNPILKHLIRNVSVVTSSYHPGAEYGKRVMCMQKIYADGPQVGKRHDLTLRMSSWLMRNGVPLDGAIAIITHWMGNLGSRTDIVSTTTSVYNRDLKYGCNDVILKEHCNPNCIFYAAKAYGESKMIRNAEDMMKGFKAYQKKLAAGGGINLKRVFPTSLYRDYSLLPGDVMMITGDTGMGKSAFIQNLVVRQYPIYKRNVLYLNLEMSEELTFRRFIQIGHGNLTKHEAMDLVASGYTDKLMDPIRHISMISVAPRVDQVVNEVNGSNPDVVVIDTTDVIEVPAAGNNDMYHLKTIIEMMRKLAQQKQIIVIGVHHISKSASRDGFIDLNSLTGNRANVTKMDHVMALTGERDDPVRTLRSLKSRDEEPFTASFIFDAERMFFEGQERKKEEPSLFETNNADAGSDHEDPLGFNSL